MDTFVTTDKQHLDSERQHIYHMLQSVGLPSGKVYKHKIKYINVSYIVVIILYLRRMIVLMRKFLHKKNFFNFFYV